MKVFDFHSMDAMRPARRQAKHDVSLLYVYVSRYAVQNIGICNDKNSLTDYGYSSTRYQSTITSVPAVISAAPIRDLAVKLSCRKTNASTNVITTLSLSMGTTLETSPTCNAL